VPTIIEIQEKIRELGYDVVGEAKAPDAPYIDITGGPLEEVAAFVRLSQDFCVVAFFIGVMQAVPERVKYSLIFDLLELNFSHPLANICLLQTKIETSEGPTQLVLAQSSFFSSDINKQDLDARMRNLRAIGLAASRLFAGRDAISNVNPFYSQLKPEPK
jgi:hypothetical protein